MKVIVDNIATEYVDQGHGEVILFLHGWGDTLHTFDSLAARLVQKYRIVRLDLPGFGQTERPPHSWGVAEYVGFVSHFLQKMNLKPTYLLGHSFGGRIIIKGISTERLSAQKIILIASAGVSHAHSLRNQVFKSVAKLGKIVFSFPLLRTFRDKLRKKLYASTGSDYLSSGALQETFVKVINEDLSQYASQITIPTLLIWGSADTQTTLDDANVLHRCINNSQLMVLDGKSHFVHQEESDQIAQAIERFGV